MRGVRRALDRKLLREIRTLSGQVISIAAVVAAGVMTVVTMGSTLLSLQWSRDVYYEEYRFADLFASVRRAPQHVERRIAALTGIAEVDTRVVFDATLDVPGLEEAAVGRLVSIPAEGQPRLNRLHLRAGRWPSPAATDEVLISERFASINGLVLGERVGAVINGRWRSLRIVGTALSPEFVYEIPGTAGIFGDERLFGVLWMPREPLAAAVDMEGSFNDIVARLSPGASEAAILAAMDRELEPWGGLGAYGRDDQISARIVSDELAQARVTGGLVPAIFLAIAAFLLNIVLSRLVATQRGQIGVLKAFGYTDGRIMRHYLGFALLAVAVGVLAGTLAGMWLGERYTELYSQFFQFPTLRHRTSPVLIASAALVSALAAILGAWSAARRAGRLQPAEAMLPEPPAEFRPLFLERLGVDPLFSPSQRIVLRNLERRPFRTFSAALGVAFATAILFIGGFLFDAVRMMMDLQFGAAAREDVSLSFNEVRPARVRHELERLPGVRRVELTRAAPITVRSGHVERRIALIGLEAGAELRRLGDVGGKVYGAPGGGVVLTSALADILGVVPGDTVWLDLLQQPGRTIGQPVAGTVAEMIGISAYMELTALNALLREGPAATGAYLSLENDDASQLFAALKRMPAVSGVSTRAAMIESFERQVQESLAVTTFIIVGLASILAIGVVYNGARIALSERGHELASLRVLGFTKREVAAILLGEQMTITGLAIPLGFGIGLFLSFIVTRAMATQMYRVPFLLSMQTFVFAAAVTLVAAGVAATLVRRRLDRADLVAVLKARE